MEKSVIEAMDQLNEWTTELIGRGVASEVTKYGNVELVHLEYGDKEYEFNPDGYNMIYIMKNLYNNPVIEAILR